MKLLGKQGIHSMGYPVAEESARRQVRPLAECSAVFACDRHGMHAHCWTHCAPHAHVARPASQPPEMRPAQRYKLGMRFVAGRCLEQRKSWLLPVKDPAGACLACLAPVWCGMYDGARVV